MPVEDRRQCAVCIIYLTFIRYSRMSYTQTLYHIVFRTHRSENTICIDHERDLYSYILGFINNIGGHLFRIGGMPDHVHILVSLPPTLAMSKFVQDLKVATSKWLKTNPYFPGFKSWTKEYAGFTYSMRDCKTIAGYIAKQKEHHRIVSFAEEYRAFLVENGVTIREEYFLKD